MENGAMRTEQIGTWGEAHFAEPATREAIGTVEADLGHPLPTELRDLLAETNGIAGEHELGLLWSVERIAADNAHFRSSTEFAHLYMPFEALLFFADAGNGDQFFVSLRGSNEIYVWDHENDSRSWVAPTVLDYLRGWMQGHITV